MLWRITIRSPAQKNACCVHSVVRGTGPWTGNTSPRLSLTPVCIPASKRGQRQGATVATFSKTSLANDVDRYSEQRAVTRFTTTPTSTRRHTNIHCCTGFCPLDKSACYCQKSEFFELKITRTTDKRGNFPEKSQPCCGFLNR